MTTVEKILDTRIMQKEHELEDCRLALASAVETAALRVKQSRRHVAELIELRKGRDRLETEPAPNREATEREAPERLDYYVVMRPAGSGEHAPAYLSMGHFDGSPSFCWRPDMNHALRCSSADDLRARAETIGLSGFEIVKIPQSPPGEVPGPAPNHKATDPTDEPHLTYISIGMRPELRTRFERVRDVLAAIGTEPVTPEDVISHLIHAAGYR